MSFRGAVQLPPLKAYGANYGIQSGNTAFTANQAKLLQIYLPRSVAFTKIRIAVVTASGNMDIGIYDTGLTKLVSTDSIAVPAAGAREISLSPAVWSLGPGTYYLGFACDNGVAVLLGNSTGSGGFNDSVIGTKAASFPLPSSLSGASFSGSKAFPLLFLLEDSY